MGKVEKVVVLSVPFLITLILVISLSGPSEDTGALEHVSAGDAQTERVLSADQRNERVPLAPRTQTRPVDGSTSTGAERTRLAPRLAQGGEPSGQRPSYGTPRERTRGVPSGPTGPTGQGRSASAPDRLLNSSVGQEPTASTAGTILLTQDGLFESYLPEFRFYAWRQGDTWSSVAARYYADAGGVERLQRANEGRERIAPGDKILIPVIDLDAQADRTTRPAAVPTRTTSSASTYVVVEGDSLWKIAEKVYGSGMRWREIFEANTDQLASQDDLRLGQVLRVP